MSKQAEYFHEKYGITKTHSAVVDAMAHVAPCKALDLGCGQGRNALYLALQGFDVTASDYNPGGLGSIEAMAQAEDLRVRTEVYDMNQAAINEHYDFMIATVVFMFLNAQRVPDIIANMKEQTQAGGYHLIVSAIDTEDYPCHMPFSFTFKENELGDYYQDWQLIEYKEEVGSMHARDAQGQPIQLKFVTMLAQKPI
ncbi:MAG: tellurite resistance methyltransferase TehB [Alcaligenaceae bacterium]|nr:tellurite resistance methyltransferase TehB [Alcaligenaceae bacterium]